MTNAYWILILVLAIAAFGIRFSGLIAGHAIQNSRLAPILDDLPGLIVIALVAASLTGQPAVSWIAGVVALGAAWVTNNVIATMVVGVSVYAGMTLSGF